MRASVTVFLAFVLLLSTVTRGEDKPSTNLNFVIYTLLEVKEKGSDGKEQTKYIQSSKKNSGDILVFLFMYQNQSQAPISDSELSYEIPKDAVFISAEGKGTVIFVSADKGEHWVKHPAMVRVKGKDGKMVEQPLPLDRITNVRWVFQEPVKPGEEGNVALKVKIK